MNSHGLSSKSLNTPESTNRFARSRTLAYDLRNPCSRLQTALSRLEIYAVANASQYMEQRDGFPYIESICNNYDNVSGNFDQAVRLNHSPRRRCLPRPRNMANDENV